MWIQTRVPRSRARCGRLVIRASADGSALRPACPAAAAADRENAARLGNPENDPFLPGGPPPFGRYRLSHILSTHDLPADVRAEYGPAVLVFEPLAGDAATAESHGRLLLLVHGGETGTDGRLRRTNGGVRLRDEDIRALAVLARDAPPHDVTLVLEPMFVLWALWRQRVSSIGARPVPPPLTGVWGIARPRQPGRDDDRPDDSWQRESSSRQDSAAGPAGLKLGGGAFGGAGATGSWEGAPATSPGATASPDTARIAGAIALGATLEALGAQAASAASSSESGEGSGSMPTTY